jgi:hypothetical protein
MVNWKGFEGKCCGFIEILSQHFPGATKESHEKPQSRYLAFWPRFKLSTSRITRLEFYRYADVFGEYVSREQVRTSSRWMMFSFMCL